MPSIQLRVDAYIPFRKIVETMQEGGEIAHLVFSRNLVTLYSLDAEYVCRMQAEFYAVGDDDDVDTSIIFQLSELHMYLRKHRKSNDEIFTFQIDATNQVSIHCNGSSLLLTPTDDNVTIALPRTCTFKKWPHFDIDTVELQTMFLEFAVAGATVELQIETNGDIKFSSYSDIGVVSVDSFNTPANKGVKWVKQPSKSFISGPFIVKFLKLFHSLPVSSQYSRIFSDTSSMRIHCKISESCNFIFFIKEYTGPKGRVIDPTYVSVSTRCS